MNNAEATEARRIIQLLGGLTRTGELFGISKAAVWQWGRNGIPSSRLMYLRLARPHLFPASADQPPAAPATPAPSAAK